MFTKHTLAVRDRAQSNQRDRLSARRVVRLHSTITTVAPMSCEQLKKFFLKLRGYSGPRTTYLTIRLMLYTFMRFSEMRHGKWEDVKIDDALWDIPADRSKSKRRHLVPLSIQAICVLRELHKITGGSENMFPDLRLPQDVMNEIGFRQAMRQLNMPFGGYVFRATALKYLGEMGVNGRLLGMQLGYAEEDKLRRINCAADMRERRKLMQQWADWLDTLEEEAVEGE